MLLIFLLIIKIIQSQKSFEEKCSYSKITYPYIFGKNFQFEKIPEISSTECFENLFIKIKIKEIFYNLRVSSSKNFLWLPIENCINCLNSQKKINMKNEEKEFSDFYITKENDENFEGFFKTEKINFFEEKNNLNFFHLKIFFIEKLLINTNFIGDGEIGFGIKNGKNIFLDNLFEKNEIKKKTVFFLTQKSDYYNMNSNIIIGEDFENIENLYGNFVWINSDKNSWSFFGENFKIGDDKIKEKTKIILEIEKNNILLPSLYIRNIIEFLEKENIFCQNNFEFLKLKCDFEDLMIFPNFSKIAILTFFSENNYFVINLNFLINEKKSDFLKGSFILDIYQSENDSIILGYPFFKKYLVFFDFEKEKIAFQIFDRKFNRLQSFMNQYKLFQFIFIILLALIISHFFVIYIKSSMGGRDDINYLELDIIS